MEIKECGAYVGTEEESEECFKDKKKKKIEEN
jgi:hypothetical protein